MRRRTNIAVRCSHARAPRAHSSSNAHHAHGWPGSTATQQQRERKEQVAKPRQDADARQSAAAGPELAQRRRLVEMRKFLRRQRVDKMQIVDCTWHMGA